MNADTVMTTATVLAPNNTPSMRDHNTWYAKAVMPAVAYKTNSQRADERLASDIVEYLAKVKSCKGMPVAGYGSTGNIVWLELNNSPQMNTDEHR